MKTIESITVKKIEIKKSKFIGILIPLKDEKDIKEQLKQIFTLYPNATHYCYAYIYKDYKKANDDKEPHGTAGIPILQVLEHNEIKDVLCVVVRYFGGIKLGAGGLLRAYTQIASETVKQAHIIEMESGISFTWTCSFDNMKRIEMMIKNIPFHKTFQENVIIKGNTKKEVYEQILPHIKPYILTREEQFTWIKKDT